MTYTLWSRGRLLGHTDLGFQYRERGVRCGWIHPTPAGEQAFEILTEPSRLALSNAPGRPTLVVDLASAYDRIESLKLELCGDDGQPMKTSDIGINDTHLLLQWADLGEPTDDWATAPFDASDVDTSLDDDSNLLECDEVEPAEWDESTFPRYQVLLTLLE